MSDQMKEAAIVHADAGSQVSVLGHGFRTLLSSADTRGDSYIFEVISPAGAFVPPHAHQHEDEYGYIAQGEYEIFLGDRTYEAQAGALLHFPRNIAHGFRNVGTTAGKTIWISFPGVKVEAFFAELAALPADAPPDMAKVGAIFARYDIQAFPPPAM
ncbi:MAG: cupin domain-containing protein [Caldilinea sp.]|nr:cupin domain-containing protein [Caldilinea sp.]MCB0058824.1 cupin domain-containing protein [Caldilineaceae bacterium]MCB0038590.1 cupin domain-containing protein [Caldilinea sp.]MCB0048839.1 cupin domain-containing protein [Caldilinea sp.]MCB0065549.1 cupin domain-containing protein [Caldilineaceae bacterium]